MTLVIIAVTVIITVIAFNSEEFMARLMLNPYQVMHKREWYRLFTHGFLHADWTHLIINMIVLFSFGSNVERWFQQLKLAGDINSPALTYSILYFGGIVVSSLIIHGFAYPDSLLSIDANPEVCQNIIDRIGNSIRRTAGKQ